MFCKRYVSFTWLHTNLKFFWSYMTLQICSKSYTICQSLAIKICPRAKREDRKVLDGFVSKDCIRYIYVNQTVRTTQKNTTTNPVVSHSLTSVLTSMHPWNIVICIIRFRGGSSHNDCQILSVYNQQNIHLLSIRGIIIQRSAQTSYLFRIYKYLF